MKKRKLFICLLVLILSTLLLVGCSTPDFYGEDVSRATSGITYEDAESTASYSLEDFTKEEKAALEAVKLLQQSLRNPETTIIYKITYLKNNKNADLLDIYIDFDAINENNLRERAVAGVIANDPVLHQSLPTYLDLETTVDNIQKVFAEANKQLDIQPSPSSQESSN
ncbi:MAG: hypothetical protein HFE39_03390 [Clostridiales bacterium]|jgi:predicted small secreted protein|nr:hypothetical protein [Clostridiales bacterium]